MMLKVDYYWNFCFLPKSVFYQMFIEMKIEITLSKSFLPKPILLLVYIV
jgi:hypothetical protein